jgi:hypothetical protein
VPHESFPELIPIEPEYRTRFPTTFLSRVIVVAQRSALRHDFFFEPFSNGSFTGARLPIEGIDHLPESPDPTMVFAVFSDGDLDVFTTGTLVKVLLRFRLE